MMIMQVYGDACVNVENHHITVRSMICRKFGEFSLKADDSERAMPRGNWLSPLDLYKFHGLSVALFLTLFPITSTNRTRSRVKSTRVMSTDPVALLQSLGPVYGSLYFGVIMTSTLYGVTCVQT